MADEPEPSFVIKPKAMDFPRPGSPNWEDTINIHARPAPETLGIVIPSKTSVASPVLASSTVREEASGRRVFITCGRGDSFVLAVEEGPEWEATWQAKFDLQTVLAILPILRALGTHILDRTGGELAAATMEAQSGFSGSRIPEAQSPASPSGKVQRAPRGVSSNLKAGVNSQINTVGGTSGEWESAVG